MIVRRVELKHFGRFDEASFTFAPGLNLVSGANETGKSTLMEAIPTVLFGTRDKERFRPWGREGSCGALLELETPVGHRVTIEREILTDRVLLAEYDQSRQQLVSFEGKVSPQGRSSERASYLGHLERILGHADEELFRASLFFRQGSLEIDAPQEIAPRIKAILSGCGEIDYDQVLDSLAEDYFAITRENPWGKDKAKERELEEVRAGIAELEARWYAVRTRNEELARLRAGMTECEARLAQLRSELEQGREYLEWVRRQWRLEEQEASLRRDYGRIQRTAGKLGELQGEREGILRELRQLGLPEELPEHLPQLLADAEGIRKEMIALQGEGNRLRRERAALGNVPWQKALVASLILLAAFIFVRENLLLVGLGAGALLLFWGVMLRRLIRLNAARAAYDAQLDQVVARRESAQAAMAEIETVLQFNGLPSSAVDMVKMEKNLSRHQLLVQRCKEIESALAVLDRPETINDEQETLTRELAVVAERRDLGAPTQAAIGMKPDELPAAEARLQALTEQITAAEREFFELGRQEAALSGLSADLRTIEEEGEALREREGLLERRKAALALACDLLRETVEEFRCEHVDRFAAEIGQTLAFVTRNRYDAVRFDSEFSPQVRWRGTDWVGVDRLSRGAQDAVFIGVRLALTRHLTRRRHLPLLLDDPFVHLDRSRIAAALKLLERVAAEHQIVLFSHSEALLHKARSDGWHLISTELPPAATSQPAKPRPKERVSDDGQQLSLL